MKSNRYPLIIRYLLALNILIGMSNYCQAQFPFYFSSGNFNPPNSWNQSAAVRMGTVANTNIQIAPATAVGNCYFRFFNSQNGGTIYEPSGITDVLIPLSSAFPLQVSGGNGKAFYFATTNLTDNYIFKTTGSGAPGTTQAAILRVQGPVQTITGISRFPAGNVYAGQDVTITATISGTFSTGQAIYLRYTLDKWNSSTIVTMSGSGKSYSAVILGSVNTAGARLDYYVFTSGSALTITHVDADLMTVNLYNNDFKNFTYSVDCDLQLGNTKFTWIQTDKARYHPGDEVHFIGTFTDTVKDGTLLIKYWHLADSISEESVLVNNLKQYSWNWSPPIADYRAYLVELKLIQNGNVVDSTSIAIDVSSNWKKFPRYGFLSGYPYTDSLNRNLLFSHLNRYHLNGLQFYDVNYKHHMPLAGTVDQPDTLWNDIANRATYLSTVKDYINLAHQSNMMAMNYNLLYGSYSNSAVTDGVLNQWGLYTDAGHQNHLKYTLPAGWASDLQVENPADTGWQSYIFANTKKLFQDLPYDGWHVDQLGSMGSVYDYYGQQVNLAASFGTYLQQAKQRLSVPLVMNAVTNYGQAEIAKAPVEFLYTEVWPPFETYNDLVQLIDTNNGIGNNTLATVLAAYINRGISNNPGMFNNAAVLFVDAAIFAAGGSHIEVGEHLLGNEYFPNSNLLTTCTLQQKLIAYYDFLTAYQNLLRDSVSVSSTTIQTTGSYALSTSASLGKIWVMSKQKAQTQLFHLINLVNATTLNWNDPSDNQPQPNMLQNIPFSFTTDSVIKKIFVASPDWNNGCPVQLAFTKVGSTVSFTLPSLTYWTMVSIEYGTPEVTGVSETVEGQFLKVSPNPFANQLDFKFRLDQSADITIKIMDETGRTIYQTQAKEGTGLQTVILNLPAINRGLYFWSADIKTSDKNNVMKTGKLIHW